MFVLLGSKWCGTYRKRIHYKLHQENVAVTKALNSYNCSAFCSIHDTLENLQNYLSETPAKKKKKKKIDAENNTTDEEEMSWKG